MEVKNKYTLVCNKYYINEYIKWMFSDHIVRKIRDYENQNRWLKTMWSKYWTGDREGLSPSLWTKAKWERKPELETKSQVSVTNELFTLKTKTKQKTVFSGPDINQMILLLPKILLTHTHLWPWALRKNRTGS